MRYGAGQNWTFNCLPDYAFPRLRSLLKDLEPGLQPIDLALGEPKHPFPAFVTDCLARHAADYGRYPPPFGTPDFLEACAAWLTRRYGLAPGAIDPAAQISALNGTREGLFMAAQTLAGHKSSVPGGPVVLMPNPFYQCYAAAAVSIGAEPVFLPATEQTGHLPDLDAIAPALLARTVAVYLCSPANPQGTVANRAYWHKLIQCAEEYDFAVFADECYAEIYDTTAPPGVLEVACGEENGGSAKRVLAFHSLSKRSNLPGLRSGFVAGDASLIARLRKLRSYGGAPSPLPVLAAATAAWSEDAHVEDNRALYRAKIDVAEACLADRFGFFRPPGGFFLWLNTARHGLSGEEAAMRLWREAGLRVLPGAYLARGTAEDRTPTANPGADHIRLALVQDIQVTTEAMSRLIATVGG